MNNNTFGKRLRQLRKKQNMNQSELAKILDVSPSTIGMYERGLRYADIDKLIEISNYFNVPVDYLIKDSSTNATELSKELKELCELHDDYCKLNEDNKFIIDTMIKTMLEKQKDK